MEFGLILSPNVWIVESLHSIVVPGITLVARAWDWKRLRKRSVSTPLSSASRSGDNLIWSPRNQKWRTLCSDCNGNYLMITRKLKLMLGIKLIMNEEWKIIKWFDQYCTIYVSANQLNPRNIGASFWSPFTARCTLLRRMWRKWTNTLERSVFYRIIHLSVFRHQNSRYFTPSLTFLGINIIYILDATVVVTSLAESFGVRSLGHHSIGCLVSSPK